MRRAVAACTPVSLSSFQHPLMPTNVCSPSSQPDVYFRIRPRRDSNANVDALDMGKAKIGS